MVTAESEIINGIPLYQRSFLGLSLLTQEKDLPPKEQDLMAEICEQYLQTWSLLRQLNGDEGNFSIGSAGTSQILLLSGINEPAFEQFYHTPGRFNQLPAWVNGYVNTGIGTYVTRDYQRYIRQMLLNDGCEIIHELGHILLPDFLKISRKWLENNAPLWMKEAICVALAQRSDDGWFKQSLGEHPITISDIIQKGFFAIDRRPSHESLSYQYAERFAEQLGLALSLREEFEDSLGKPPFHAIFKLIRESHDSNICIDDRLLELGIVMKDIDTAVYNSLGVELRFPDNDI